MEAFISAESARCRFSGDAGAAALSWSSSAAGSARPLSFLPTCRPSVPRLWPVAFCLRSAVCVCLSPRGRPCLPHRLENLGDPEVDLAPLEIDLDDLHADAIAEPEHAAVVLAAQDVRALDEPVVVVGHRRHVHHALDEVLDELDVEAERR